MEKFRNNYRGEWGGLWNRIARYVVGMGYTRNKGTVTGILMNGVSKGNAGDIDLGNVQEKIDADHKLSADLIEDGENNKVINVKPDWNAASGAADEILNKPTIPAEQIQSDWNQSDSTAKDYIKNKPTIPAPVTESTVSGWGFTKNRGTVTSTGGTVTVNNIQVVSALPQYPDANTLYLITGS